MRAPLSIAVLLALTALSAHASDRGFVGFARSLDDGRLLYIESHFVAGAGQADEKRVVLYRCAPDAPPFARKELEYDAGRTAPTFAFDDARSGFSEGFTRSARGTTVFARAGAHAPTRTGPIDPAAVLVVDAGFDEFVLARWDALADGAAIKVAFLVPSLLDAVNFKVRKVNEEHIDGELASVMRLSLAGPLGWFLPDIDVSYRQRDRRLMRYRGLTNIRSAAGVLLEAQIDFPDGAREEAAVDLPALRALPLASRCP